jgi:uncharacterized protein (TIGR00369 family)
MNRLNDDQWCFACGPQNPHGLRLTGFRQEGEEYVVEFVPERHHQGWQGITHGGIVATLLDEVMTRLLWVEGQDAVTAELTVRYHRPLPTGEQVQARSRRQESRGRLVRTEAEIRDQAGALIASAEAKFMLVKD